MQAAGTTSKEEFILKFDLKKDLKRLLVVCLASVLMALNIKSFVRTGGLYPGGATGLSLLIQRGAQMYLGLAGSSSIFSRRRRTVTSTVRMSP